MESGLPIIRKNVFQGRWPIAREYVVSFGMPVVMIFYRITGADRVLNRIKHIAGLEAKRHHRSNRSCCKVMSSNKKLSLIQIMNRSS
ncbi:hypothetical protein NDU88_004562 [Pleurodeles waltl]|uniref:Uncharacterized protein n=1 Tax=Pleurodeles waltl TaxID=8319 RepID=A0AAV7SJ54_PLEWA|nr:hypothetical protein NDU88_004562 [Pleurodeles waltl]